MNQFYRRSQVWIIFFFRTDIPECDAVRDEYKILSDKMYGVFKIIAVDCDEDEEISEEFLVFDTPTIVVFTDNLDDEGEKYQGK